MDRYINGFTKEKITLTEVFVGSDATSWFSYYKDKPVTVVNEKGETEQKTEFQKPMYMLHNTYIKII